MQLLLLNIDTPTMTEQIVLHYSTDSEERFIQLCMGYMEDLIKMQPAT